MDRSKYFEKLVGLVSDGNSCRYRKLYTDLFTLKFVWDPRFPTDENQAENGKYLRVLYSDGIHMDEDPCSVFEVLIHLAQKISYITSNPACDNTKRVFEDMIGNMGLLQYSDTRYDSQAVYDIIAKWLSRDVEANGLGGPFPLRHPNRDQALVPIWDQAAEYMRENYDI